MEEVGLIDIDVGDQRRDKEKWTEGGRVLDGQGRVFFELLRYVTQYQAWARSAASCVSLREPSTTSASDRILEGAQQGCLERELAGVR